MQDIYGKTNKIYWGRPDVLKNIYNVWAWEKVSLLPQWHGEFNMET